MIGPYLKNMVSKDIKIINCPIRNSLTRFGEIWPLERNIWQFFEGFFFKKMGHSWPLFLYFRLFNTQLTVYKCSILIK